MRLTSELTQNTVNIVNVDSWTQVWPIILHLNFW